MPGPDSIAPSPSAASAISVPRRGGLRRALGRTLGRALGSDLVALGALTALALALGWHVLGLAFIHDTPFHLRLLAQHGIGDLFVDRALWRQEKNVLTPLFLLSMRLDRALFGLAPGGYYAHQLAALAAAALALYAALRRWLRPAPAGFGGALFLLGSAVRAMAPQLMVRHYFEAAALACLAVAAYAVAVRRGSWSWAAASALCWLAAALEKEIALPLVLALPLLPAGTLGKRLRFAAPHAVALAGYLVYRAAMLDRALAGHGFVDPDGLRGSLLAFPGELLTFAGGLLAFAGGLLARLGAGSVVGWTALALAVAAALLLPRAAVARFTAGVGLAAAPALPFAADLQPRFALAPWLVLAAAAAAGLARLSARAGRLRWLAAAWGVAILASTWLAGRPAADESLAVARRMSAETRWFLAAAPRFLLAHPATLPATLGELSWLRRYELAGGAAPGWFADDLFVCLGRVEDRPVAAYDPARRAVGDLPAASLEAIRAGCSVIRWRAPLAADLDWRDGVLRWRLAAPGDGSFAFVFDDGAARVFVAARSGFRFTGDRVAFRVRFESAEGWVTYSPPLDLERGGTRTWRRSRRARRGARVAALARILRDRSSDQY